VYFESDIPQALKIRSASTHHSISELIDEGVRPLMHEDQEGLVTLSERANEPEILYEDLLNDLKLHGKI